MKKMLQLFALLLLPLAFASAQTTYTALGYGLCGAHDTDPLSNPLYCTVALYQPDPATQNLTFQGYLTFFLVNNKTTTIGSGQVWLQDKIGNTISYASPDVTGAIDTTNKLVNFSFSDHAGFSGTTSVGYRIQPGYCGGSGRGGGYCHPPRVVITTGTVTLNPVTADGTDPMPLCRPRQPGCKKGGQG